VAALEPHGLIIAYSARAAHRRRRTRGSGASGIHHASTLSFDTQDLIRQFADSERELEEKRTAR
jgi:hypothetical protein